VIADQHISIQQYEELAKYVFKNLDPANDIYFSTGPMDVLDHSCSKMGFGGKMCIDGTRKYEEESNDAPGLLHDRGKFSVNRILDQFPEVKKINEDLLKKDISCIIIAVEKNRKGHIRELHEKICSLEDNGYVKMILYVEHTVDPSDLAVALWRFCNNLDPKRDHFYSGDPQTIGFDGTRKTKEFDNFNRDWPNIIVADDNTIRSVDEKWESLGLGEFIPSPSLKFKDQLYGEKAVVY
jgi:4-hydroxy-3-polyprenylbenzoate decarboxylase